MLLQLLVVLFQGLAELLGIVNQGVSTLIHLELNLKTNIQIISSVLNVIIYIKLGLLLLLNQETASSTVGNISAVHT
jgi:hypothetical protein